jgi:hypothetical protein
MSTQLATVPTTDMAAPTNGTALGFVAHLDGHWRLANMLVRSGMLPKALNRPEAAMAVLLKAHELNLPAMYAFANLHFFDGRLVESAALMVGMAAERCGVTYEVVEWTDERCELLFRRPGWEKPLPSVFTIEDAKRAGLTGKDNWRKYPKSMLLARAQAQGVRAIAPDRFGGMHSSEEVRDMPPASASHAADVAAALAAPDFEEGSSVEADYETVSENENGDATETTTVEEATTAEVEQDDAGEIPGIDDRTRAIRARYFATLNDMGMSAHSDRRPFQQRLADAGKVNGVSCLTWKAADYREALAALEDIKRERAAHA